MKKHMPARKTDVEPKTREDFRYVSKCGLKIRSRDVGDFSDPDLCGRCEKLARPKIRRQPAPLKQREGYYRYKLGNFLRGYFEGYFKNGETAWRYLSHRFNLSFPSEGGRHVQMSIWWENEFGFSEFTTCKKSITSMEVMNRSATMRLTRTTL